MGLTKAKLFWIKKTIVMFGVQIPVLVLGVLLSAPFHLHPQEKLNFEHITSQQGLSNSIIYCIFQDSKGFLWLGTDYGLNKYDGYKFITYKHRLENPDSLSDNTVRAIINDPSGVLWIGTFGGGLDKFDPMRETFTHYQNNPENPNSLSDNYIFSISRDRSGVLWIGTYGGGLDKFSPKTETFTNYRNVPGNSRSLSNNNVRIIYEDRDSAGILWIGTLGGGLNKFDSKTGTFTRYLFDPGNPRSLSDDSVITILEDRDREGILWIGTLKGGLNKFDSKTGTFTRFLADPGNPGSLSSSDVREIYLDRCGTLWVGTANGLNRFHPKKQEFTRYLADPKKPGSLSRSFIRSIYEDFSGTLWIGTQFGGLNKLNRKKKKFNHYSHVLDDPNSLGDNNVKAIYEDRHGDFWIGTTGGLNKWDRKNGIFTTYRNNPRDPSSLSNNHVYAIYESRSGQFLVGTMGGLNLFDREKGRFTRYVLNPADFNTLSDRIVFITEDKWGYLWVGSTDGLSKVSLHKKTCARFKHSPIKPDSLSHNLIFSILEDHSGVLWVGTLNGLNKFNREKETFSRYLSDPGDTGSLSSSKINFIFEDRSRILWIGTYEGLNKYDRKRDTFTHYRVNGELPGDLGVTMGILEDHQGNLWISTNNGLSKFDPKKGEFKTYDSHDGLQDNEFSYACWKSKSGEMFFGGINGFNAFFPDDIVDNPYRPSVVITGFKISNRYVRIDEEIDGLTILKKHISETNEIKLPHKHTTLSFEYVGLHYAAPESNRYAYKMEKLEKDWNYVGNRRFAIYPHLAPGHYVFKVKASNNDNVWNETGASVKIYIPLPYWRQWWFLVLVGVIFISLLLGGYYHRTRRLRKRLAEQQRVQELLEQSRDEMKKSRDIAEFRNAENEKLIAAISSIFITVDAHGKISQWNHPAEKFFQIPKAGVNGQLFVDILKEYIPGDKLEEITEKARNQEKAVNNIEIQVNFPRDKEPKQLLAAVNPIIDKGGKKFGFLFLAEDITHQKKEQIQLLVSQKLEALGQMAAGIAHEIRSPLQYIGDNVQFLLENFDSLLESCARIRDSIKDAAESRKKVDAEKLNQYLREKEFDFFIEEIPAALDHIINGVSRVSHIVRYMTEFFHIGSEAFEKADLNEMLKTTLVVAQTRIKNVADLQTNYAPGLPLLYCSMGELNQVFLNLLINAVDAVAETGKHGLIKVSTKQKDSELIVEISDNGIGIPDEIKDKIFTPFFTTKKVGQGTGQGLPFSYGIVVERHKGKLYFKSKANEGTTFFVHLPVTEDPDEH